MLERSVLLNIGFDCVCPWNRPSDCWRRKWKPKVILLPPLHAQRKQQQKMRIHGKNSLRTWTNCQWPFSAVPMSKLRHQVRNILLLLFDRSSLIDLFDLDHQPNLYCIYKFFDFADHDSNIIPSSNNPNFDDRMQYPIQMDAELDRYLKQSQLTVFVFDDQDTAEGRYAARADIPLIPLAHDNPIRGTFDLRDDRGEKNGTMDVILKWTYAYIPPSAATRTPAQRAKAGPSNTREPLALLPDESISGHRTLADKKKEMHVKVTPRDVLGPDGDHRPKPGRVETTFARMTPSRIRSNLISLQKCHKVARVSRRLAFHETLVIRKWMDISRLRYVDHPMPVSIANEVTINVGRILRNHVWFSLTVSFDRPGGGGTESVATTNQVCVCIVWFHSCSPVLLRIDRLRMTRPCDQHLRVSDWYFHFHSPTFRSVFSLSRWWTRSSDAIHHALCRWFRSWYCLSE